MGYIAEVLDDDKVWLLNENRRLVSMHNSVQEARESCIKRYKSEPRVIDRRKRLTSGDR